MSFDRTALIHRALRNLGVLPQGQSPNAEEYQSVSDLVDGLIASLSAREVVHITDVDTLDDAYLIPLGHCLAWSAASEFGAGADQALAALAQQGEMQLKKMEADKYTRSILQADYY